MHTLSSSRCFAHAGSWASGHTKKPSEPAGTRAPLAPEIVRPNIVDVALLLRRNAYRPQLVQRFDQAGHYFQAAAAIANSGGVFHLTRKLGFPVIGEAIDMLERHWSELGLTEPRQ